MKGREERKPCSNFNAETRRDEGREAKPTDAPPSIHVKEGDVEGRSKGINETERTDGSVSSRSYPGSLTACWRLRVCWCM
mmetsp:Transcript_14185/g.28458  ORF Transcript_14185/g.28458 Transcript_14185/m.28458 type:complete len:80 (-) Transcript_14185:294-533(-)